MITYTYSHHDGAVVEAEDDTWSWWWGSHSYLQHKPTGREYYGPTSGWSRAEGWGSDPASPDDVASACEFFRQIHVESARNIEARQAARRAEHNAAMAVLKAIPAAAQAELDEINAGWRRRAGLANEGGEGYVHQAGWSDQTGREVLTRHGLADQIDAIDAAIATLSRH